MLQKITMIEVKMSSRGQKMCLGLTFFESPCTTTIRRFTLHDFTGEPKQLQRWLMAHLKDLTFGRVIK